MSLANLIAKQKAKAAEGNTNDSTPVAAPDTPALGAVSTPAVSAGPRLSFLAKGKPSSSPSPSESTQVPAKPDKVAQVVDTKLSLDDIADTVVEGIDTSDRGQYAFSDEIPATAPSRDLPADLEPGMKQFVTQLNSIYEVVHDPELFGQFIRTIMQELRENPDYSKLLADQDVHTMIRGLRSSMGLAKIKKVEKQSKARGSKKSPASAQVLSTADEMFNSEDW